MPQSIHVLRRVLVVAALIAAAFPVNGAASAQEQFDDAVTPPEPPGGWPAPADPRPGPFGRDGGEIIDVLIVFTAQARTDAGGAAQIQAKIAAGIDAANHALANSGALPRLNLVQTSQVEYTESYNAIVDLDRLQRPADGYVDEVHALRDAYGADLVGMVVSRLQPEVGGVGYLMTPETPLFEAWAFSVVIVDAADTLTLAHELGHNMGLAHDEVNAQDQGAFSYSFGHRLSGMFRTVMAYPCSWQGLPSCPRVAHFSNPSVSYGGSPTGVADESENARTLNETAFTVSNFRQSVGGNLPPIVLAGPDVQIGIGAPFTRNGTFTDDGSGPWSATVDYGDDSGPQALPLSEWDFALEHSYPAAGEYQVGVCLTDEEAKQGCDSVAVTVSAEGGLPDGSGDGVAFFDDAIGFWHIPIDGTVVSYYFGNPDDVAFVGDWDCDGVATAGLYRQSDGYVYLRNSHTQGVADVAFFFGNPGDVPVPGDFSGDGCDTVSIYRPSEGKFYLVNDLGSQGQGLGPADVEFYFGDPFDDPFAGDFDGDGVDEVGLHRPATGFAYLRMEHAPGSADLSFFYGDPGDVVFAGDWTGDGQDTVGLYRPSESWVFLRYENGGGVADESYPAAGTGAPVAGPFS